MAAIRFAKSQLAIRRRAWHSVWLFACGLLLVTLPAGCSDTEEAKPEAKKVTQPVLPQPGQQPKPAGEQAKAGGTVAKKKKKKDDTEEPAPKQAVKKLPANKSVGDWTLDELKTALANKDPRYVGAVMMQGAKSHGDAKKGDELSQLLVAVAKMPADGSGSAAKSFLGGAGRKRGSKRGDDDEPSAAANAPAATAPATTTAPNAAAAPPAAAPAAAPPTGFKVRFGQGSRED